MPTTITNANLPTEVAIGNNGSVHQDGSQHVTNNVHDHFDFFGGPAIANINAPTEVALFNNGPVSQDGSQHVTNNVDYHDYPVLF